MAELRGVYPRDLSTLPETLPETRPSRAATGSDLGPTGRLRRLMADAATEARVPVWTGWVTAAVPVLGTVVLGVLFVVARPAFYLVQQEDNVVEWGQFALCLGISAVALLAAWRLARRSPRSAALLVLVALAYFFVGGEEISWGQRVFGLVTPEELAAANQQSETNLHNINTGVDVQLLFKIGSSLLALVALLTTVWVRLLHHTGTAFLRLVTPPVFAAPGFVAMALYWVVARALPMADAPLSRFQEWVELSLYVSLAASVICIITRSSHRWGDRRVIVWIGLALAVLTVVFSIMTVHTGIKPGNV